jgi:hypothetical protein
MYLVTLQALGDIAFDGGAGEGLLALFVQEEQFLLK